MSEETKPGELIAMYLRADNERLRKAVEVMRERFDEILTWESSYKEETVLKRICRDALSEAEKILGE